MLLLVYVTDLIFWFVPSSANDFQQDHIRSALSLKSIQLNFNCLVVIFFGKNFQQLIKQIDIWSKYEISEKILSYKLIFFHNDFDSLHKDRYFQIWFYYKSKNLWHIHYKLSKADLCYLTYYH